MYSLFCFGNDIASCSWNCISLSLSMHTHTHVYILVSRYHSYTVSPKQVPFLDICNTMLDPTLPLTVLDYEEFGDPRHQTEFETIQSYSPYDNLPSGICYPSVLVTASFYDSRYVWVLFPFRLWHCFWGCYLIIIIFFLWVHLQVVGCFNVRFLIFFFSFGSFVVVLSPSFNLLVPEILHRCFDLS